jgi:PPM family protein phosphatase
MKDKTKNVQFKADTHPGKQRDNNEDNYIAQQLWHANVVLLAAIDGVGGYEGGEIAAKQARDKVSNYLTISVNGERTQLIREAIAEANNEIYRQAKANLALAQMSCVLTVAIADIQKQLVYFGHVGDTRLYRYRAGALNKLSRDHSLVGYREEIGALTEAEAMNHPQRNEISRLLGSDLHGANDDNFIDTGTESFLPNDVLLLCSDGLTDMITSRQIVGILEEQTTLETKVKALIAAANEAGGKDNITVVLATYTKAVSELLGENTDKSVKEVISVTENTNKNENTHKSVKEVISVSENTNKYQAPRSSLSSLHLLLAGLTGFTISTGLIWALFLRPTS